MGFNKINENNDINYYVKLKDSNFPAKFQYTSKNYFENRVFAVFRCIANCSFEQKLKEECNYEFLVYLDNGQIERVHEHDHIHVTKWNDYSN